MEKIVLGLGFPGICVFLAGPASAHLRWVAPLRGFSMMLAGAAACVLSVVIAIAGIVYAGAAGRCVRLLVSRAMPGLGVAVFLGVMVARSRKFPPINDITTTPDAAPRFNAAAKLPENAGRDMSYPSAFISIQQNAYPTLAPLILDKNPGTVFEAVRRAAHGRKGWTVTFEDPGSRIVEAVAESGLFHFRDDIIVEVRPAQANAAVHMRSKSRDGRGDIGANAQRIESFLRDLSANKI